MPAGRAGHNPRAGQPKEARFRFWNSGISRFPAPAAGFGQTPADLRPRTADPARGRQDALGRRVAGGGGSGAPFADYRYWRGEGKSFRSRRTHAPARPPPGRYCSPTHPSPATLAPMTPLAATCASPRTPPRIASLIITVWGDAVVPRGGSLWLGSLQAILDRFGCREGQVRTAMSRLTEEGWLLRTRQGRRPSTGSARAAPPASPPPPAASMTRRVPGCRPGTAPSAWCSRPTQPWPRPWQARLRPARRLADRHRGRAGKPPAARPGPAGDPRNAAEAAAAARAWPGRRRSPPATAASPPASRRWPPRRRSRRRRRCRCACCWCTNTAAWRCATPICRPPCCRRTGRAARPATLAAALYRRWSRPPRPGWTPRGGPKAGRCRRPTSAGGFAMPDALRDFLYILFS